MKGSLLEDNFGYDDDEGNYNVVLKDHIAYWYEVTSSLGSGSFGQCLKCFDHKHNEYVAVKIMWNKKKFHHQAGVEVKILQHLKDNDPEDKHNIVWMKNYFVFWKHICIAFELLAINLYDFSQTHDFSLDLIWRFAI